MQDIRQTLQGLIVVQEPSAESVIGGSEFLIRCQLIAPEWRDKPINRIFVDGFANKCYTNSWKVYTDKIELNIELWAGFALANGTWWEHAWCMIGDRIIETTHPFLTYYGAQLTISERENIGQRFGASYPPPSAKDVRVYTVVRGARRAVPYVAKVHNHAIGRERNLVSGKIREGLGRTTHERAQY